MNGDVHPKLSELEDAFLSYQDVEDCWKLDLCYLVEGLLLADESQSEVNIDFLSFVEDEEFFFFFSQYPWGLDTYHKTMFGVNKDMVHYQ